MMDTGEKKTCCSSKEEIEKETRCPRCHGKGKGVEVITVRYLVQGRHQSRVDPTLPYRFCLTPDCPVVYYSEEGKSVFTKEDLNERVTIKERDDPPLCYCFNFFRHDIEREFEEKGTITIPDFISAQVKAGNCLCEHTNPQGSCCLGNIYAVIKELQKEGQKR